MALGQRHMGLSLVDKVVVLLGPPFLPVAGGVGFLDAPAALPVIFPPPPPLPPSSLALPLPSLGQLMMMMPPLLVQPPLLVLPPLVFPGGRRFLADPVLSVAVALAVRPLPVRAPQTILTPF